MLSINDQPAFLSIMLDFERLCRTSVLIFNILIYVLVRMKGVYDSVQSGPYLDIAECKAQRRFPSGFLGIRCRPSHFNPIEIMYSLQSFSTLFLSVSHVSVTFLQPPHIQWWGYRLNFESSMLLIHAQFAHSSHSTHNISACLAFLTMFGMFSSEAAVEN